MRHHQQFYADNWVKAKGKNQRGFTIIELIMAIIVAAILMAVAIPNFEALVYGTSSNRAVLELTSNLQLARMKAIRTHRPVTVSFNNPAQDQYTVSWTDDNLGNQSRVTILDPRSGRISFDNAPPGGVNPPDGAFVFTNLGFIQPGLGGNIGNIYLVDNKNGYRFAITTTVAGGIEEQRWDGNNWSGPDYEYVAP